MYLCAKFEEVYLCAKLVDLTCVYFQAVTEILFIIKVTIVMIGHSFEDINVYLISKVALNSTEW